MAISGICAAGGPAMTSGGFYVYSGDFCTYLVNGLLVVFCVIVLYGMLFGAFCVSFVWLRSGLVR